MTTQWYGNNVCITNPLWEKSRSPPQHPPTTSTRNLYDELPMLGPCLITCWAPVLSLAGHLSYHLLRLCSITTFNSNQRLKLPVKVSHDVPCKCTFFRIFTRWYLHQIWLLKTLQWRNNERGGASNQQLHDCLLNRLFRRRPKKTSKFCATGLCEGNSLVTGEIPAQMASNAGNGSIWWRHNDMLIYTYDKIISIALSRHDALK